MVENWLGTGSVLRSVALAQHLRQSQSGNSSWKMPAVAPVSSFVVQLDDHYHSVYPSLYILNGFVHFGERHSLDIHDLYYSPPQARKPAFSAVQIDSPHWITTITSRPSACPLEPAIHSRHRSLVDQAIFCVEMTALATRELSSPPGLTDSKSFSFHTSSLSDTESALSDITHFEDISLEKEVNIRQTAIGHDTAKLVSSTMNGGSKSASVVAPRELTVGDRRQSAPTLHGSSQPSSVFNSRPGLALPKGANGRRSYHTSSSTSLARRAMSNHSRSRSPSPSAPSFTPILPKSATITLAPDWHAVNPPLKSAPVRRGSWAPNRKTAKELEKEYDDLDEELPDDASLWNVPLSPRPSTSENMKPPPSFHFIASPQKDSPVIPPWRKQTSVVIPPTSQGISTGTASPAVSDTFGPFPNSPVKPMYPRGMSTGAMPDRQPLANSRAKSWTVAMSELSEEAKDLTAALESLADKSGRQREENVQRGSLSARPSMDIRARTATSVDLPPLRTNNFMIDPLPMSKEKEKVLSRTRPSWLPPKSQKEEKKHLKEYQRMMELSLQAGIYT